MPTANDDPRQQLLTRSDLAQLGVPSPRILRWMASGALEQIGAVPGTNGAGDAVLAISTAELRETLRAVLRDHGRCAVALSPLLARAQLLRWHLLQRGVAIAALAPQPEECNEGETAFAARLLAAAAHEPITVDAGLQPALAELIEQCRELQAIVHPAAGEAVPPDGPPLQEGSDESCNEGTSPVDEEWLDPTVLVAELEPPAAGTAAENAGAAVAAAQGTPAEDHAAAQPALPADAEQLLDSAVATVHACIDAIDAAEEAQPLAQPERMGDLLAGTFLDYLARGDATATRIGVRPAADLLAGTFLDEGSRTVDRSPSSRSPGDGGSNRPAEGSSAAPDPQEGDLAHGSTNDDDVLAGEDAVDLDPLAGTFLADDGEEDTLIDYRPHTGRRRTARVDSLIDAEELAALTPTEHPAASAFQTGERAASTGDLLPGDAAAAILAQLELIHATLQEWAAAATATETPVQHAVESGFATVAAQLQKLDRLDELAETLLAADLSGLHGDLGALQSSIEAAGAATVAAIDDLPVSSPAGIPTRARARRGHNSHAMLLAIGFLLLGWGAVLWFRTGDAALTSAALVAANVVGVMALAARRR